MSESSSTSSSSSSGRFIHQGLVFDGNRRFHAAPQRQSSSSSPTSAPLTKLTAACKVLDRHFMDIPVRILAAVAISAVVVGILAAVAVNLYHHEGEFLPEVKNYVGQRMADAKGLWAKVDISEYKDYIEGFFTNKNKYLLEVTPEGSNSFLDLFKWKKNKNFNVKITDF